MLGQRIARKEIIGSDLSADRQANTEYYVHDGVNIVADLDENKELLRSYTYTPGYDNIISMTTYGDSETNTYFYIRSHNNSVVALVDEAGSVAESYEYGAYGKTTVFDVNGNELEQSALGNRYTFQGREIDWSTGLYNFRARWYDQETGRWLSKDPIGINGGLNQYVFCGNNPVMFVDPEGLKSKLEPRNGDKVLEELRFIYYCLDKYAKERFFLPSDWGEHAALFALSGGTWGRYDFKGNGKSPLQFKLGDKTYPADYFGNYVAGYQAGYGSSNLSLLRGVFYGGIHYAKGDAEDDSDDDSMPGIVAGFIAGREARNKRDEGK